MSIATRFFGIRERRPPTFSSFSDIPNLPRPSKEDNELIELVSPHENLEALRKAVIPYFSKNNWPLCAMTQGLVDLENAGLALPDIKTYIYQVVKLYKAGAQEGHVLTYNEIFRSFIQKTLPDLRNLNIYNSIDEVTEYAIEFLRHEPEIFRGIWVNLGFIEREPILLAASRI